MGRSCFESKAAWIATLSMVLAPMPHRIWAGPASACGRRCSWRAFSGITGRVCGVLRTLAKYGRRLIRRGLPICLLISTLFRTSAHLGIRAGEPDSSQLRAVPTVMKLRPQPLCKAVDGLRVRQSPPGRDVEDPLEWAEDMWNHSGKVFEERSRTGLPWPQFSSQEMMDLLTYLRSLAERALKRPAFNQAIRRKGASPLSGPVNPAIRSASGALERRSICSRGQVLMS
jgi:hypothetical protein